MKNVLFEYLGLISNAFKKICTFEFALKIAFLYYIFCALIYAIMSLVNHSHYMTLADLGIFNQGIWQWSRITFPFSTFHLSRYFLGDHFHPILILLAPFYWINSKETTLLILQPFIMLSAIIPLFKIAYEKSKSLLLSFAVIFAYSLYIPLQYTLFYDFHEVVFVAPLLSWIYWYVTKNKYREASLLLILLLLTKEEMGFLVATIGIWLLMFKRKWRKFGLIWSVAGVMYSLLTMYVLIPRIGGSYLYFNYGESGNTPIGVIRNIVNNPTALTKIFTDSQVKIKTMHETFRPYVYLPLLSPFSLILSSEQLFARFADYRNTIRWTISYHYSAQMAAIVALGFIEVMGFIRQKLKKISKPLIVVFSILIIVITRLEQINRSAVLLIKYPQFWRREEWMDYLDEAKNFVPDSASVATQNNLSSHFSTREKIYFLDKMDETEYVVVDFHEGQSDYNFFGTEKKTTAQEKVKVGIETGQYEVIFNKGEVYVLKNKFHLQ